MLDYDSWLESPYWEQDEDGDTVYRKDTTLSFNLQFVIKENGISYSGHIEQLIEYVTGYGDIESYDYKVNRDIAGDINADKLIADVFKDELKERLNHINNNQINELKTKDSLTITLCFLRGIFCDKNIHYDWNDYDGWIIECGYSDIKRIEKERDLFDLLGFLLFECDLADSDYDNMSDDELCNVLIKGLENKNVTLNTCDTYKYEEEIDPRDYYGYPD